MGNHLGPSEGSRALRRVGPDILSLLLGHREMNRPSPLQLLCWYRPQTTSKLPQTAQASSGGQLSGEQLHSMNKTLNSVPRIGEGTVSPNKTILTY